MPTVADLQRALDETAAASSSSSNTVNNRITTLTNELTRAWYPLRYHPVQAKLWDTAVHKRKRFIAAVAGRRSGKTELARRFIVLSLAYQKRLEPNYAYCLPTFAQARKVAWYPIISLIPPSWIAHPNDINKSESSIKTKFGSTLYIVGMDKPHRIEGISLDGVIVDECSDQRPELFRRTLIPMLSDRDGWAWRIGVPKRSGVGRVDYRLFFEAGLDPDHPTQASFHWTSSEILTPQQIAEAKQQLDPQEFEEQFNASWIDSGGTVYYNFSSTWNVSDNVRYIPGERIIVGCDFNVSPMCWILAHFVDGKLLVFDEIFLKDTNTPAALTHLHEKYGISHSGEWVFYGDASARARKTSATRTDYLTIKNDVRFGHKKVVFPEKNPHIRDRVACVNAAFNNAAGEKRLLISPRCKHLINDLLVMSYTEGTSDIEDYTGTDVGHTADALGYAVFKLMPIKLAKVFVPSVIIR